jgi:hypothetical protein
MRSDRRTTLATIVILMCCIGGPVSAGTMASHRVLIRAVSQSSSTTFTKVDTLTGNLEVPTIWSPQILDGNLLPLADIDEMTNLPPPFFG